MDTRQRRFTLIQNNVLFATINGIAAVSLVLTANDGAKGPNSGSYTSGDGLVGLALAALFGALAIRATVAGLYVTEHGVTVRNLFRTRSFGWSDIDRFGVHGRAGGFAAAAVFPRVGRPARVTTLAPWQRVSRNPLERVDEVVAELNGLFAGHTGNAPTAAPEPPVSRRRARPVLALVTLYLVAFAAFEGSALYRSGDHLAAIGIVLSCLVPVAVLGVQGYRFRQAKNRTR